MATQDAVNDFMVQLQTLASLTADVTQIANLQSQIAALQAQIVTLQQQLQALQGNDGMAAQQLLQQFRQVLRNNPVPGVSLDVAATAVATAVSTATAAAAASPAIPATPGL